MEKLAQDKTAKVRARIAARGDISQKMIIRLATDPSAQVRKGLLFNTKTSNTIKQEILATFYLKNSRQCPYFLFIDKKQTAFDRLDWATANLGKQKGALLFFSLRYRNAALSIIDNLTLQNDPTYKRYYKLSTQKHHFITRHSNGRWEVQKSYSKDWLLKLFAKPLTWVFSLVTENYQFMSNVGNIQLNKESYVLYWLQSNSYVIWTYYAFLFVCYMLLAILYFWFKAKEQQIQLKQQNVDLEKNLRRKAYIAEMLGHEIKSPLHSLSSMLQDEKTTKYLSRIRNAVNRISDIEGILSGLEGKVQKQDVDGFLKEYAVNTEKYKGISSVHYHSSGKPLYAFVSLEDFEIVLDHIVDNANDFRTQGTPIELSAARSSNGIEVSINNQGLPVPDEVRDHIFNYGVSSRKKADLVSQTDSSIAPNMGQGLFVVKEKLADMNATIHLQQTDNEVTFIVTLPEKNK
jgi:signal transduction histidine kinase